MQFKYIDAHCHLQFDDYASDREALVERMKEESVAGVVVGCDAESSKQAVALAEKHEHLYAAVGWHPNHTGEVFDADVGRELAQHPRVVAIGECGLDYFRPVEVNDEVKNAQKELLKKHIELATAINKPLIIHCRPNKGSMDAYQDLIEILKTAKQEHPGLRGDIHFFVGGVEEAQALIALGFTLSFTAVITFARDYDAVIKAVPLENILVETDAPYVAPASRRGSRNDPLAVVEVVAEIARIRGESVESVRAKVAENARLVFKLSACPAPNA